MSDGEYTIRSADAVADFPADQWDALTDGANPFVSHAFLSAMEDSGSVGGGSGWRSLPIIAEASDGTLAGALPAYVKQHIRASMFLTIRGPTPSTARAGIITPRSKSPRPSRLQPDRAF